MPIKNDNIPQNSSNTSAPTRRLPVLLCLDVSPSMTLNNRIQNLNAAVQQLYRELSSSTARYAVDVAVVTFSSEVIDEENITFKPLDSLKDLKISAIKDGGTNISQAVITSMKKLLAYQEELKERMGPPYLPTFILITDGNPDVDNGEPLERIQESIELVRSHCIPSPDGDTCLVAPFIVGVGAEVRRESLDPYTTYFTKKAILIDDDNHPEDAFSAVITFFSNSIKNSLRGTSDLGTLYQQLALQARRFVTHTHPVNFL